MICVECLVDQIRSDIGPQYASAHFTAFCKSWGIEHVTSSPNYAQSNGFAERQIRQVKTVKNKCLKTSESIPQALLQMRDTPIDAKLQSPAELLLNRRVATCMPSHTNKNRDDGVHDRLEERRAKMTTSYSKTSHENLRYRHCIRDSQFASLINPQRRGSEAL